LACSYFSDIITHEESKFWLALLKIMHAQILLLRNIFHFLAGSSFLTICLLSSKKTAIILIGIAAGISIFFEIIRLHSELINQWFLRLPMLFKRKEEKQISGLTHFLLAVLFTAIFFQKDIAFVSVAFLTIGDVSASICGKTCSRIKLLNKTLEGTVTNFISCLTVGLFLYYTLHLDIALSLIVIGALFSTIFELTLMWPDDNYAVFLTALTISVIKRLFFNA
jgi:dolichol kinase